LTGWTITGGTAAGAFNPGSSQYPGSAVAHGQNVAFSDGPTISQLLAESLRPGIRYTLQVAVGDRLDTPLPTFAVQLWAGGQMLAESSAPRPANGAFA